MRPLTNIRGFTLMETMVAIAVTAIVIAVATPAFGGYLARNAFDTMVSETVTSARTAQAFAQAGAADGAWGVYVGAGDIVLFQGDAYTTRDTSADQTMNYSDDIIVTGTTEYVFTARTGRTTAGTLTATNGEGDARTITVNALGMIEY